MIDLFHTFAQKSAEVVGSSWAFMMALLIILIWIVTGPIFNYSTTWQLIINSFTTIITFLMVFLIQNAQNRDSKATHLKLDELIRSTKARNMVIDAEDLTAKELEEQKNKLIEIKEKKRKKRKKSQK